MTAANADKWSAAYLKAQRTASWAKTMTRVLITQSTVNQPKWEVVNFLGPKKVESRGIVDLIAIRRDHTRGEEPLQLGDLFEIVLIQVKGGSARMPTAKDNVRLAAVGKHYSARAILLAEWKQGTRVKLRRLGDDLQWSSDAVDPQSIFAPKRVKTPTNKGTEAVAVKSKVRRIVGSSSEP